MPGSLDSVKACRQPVTSSKSWSRIMPWQWLSTTGSCVKSKVSMRHLRSRRHSPAVGSGDIVNESRGGNEGDGLSPGHRSDRFSWRQKPRMMERYVWGVRTVFDPYEQHERP